MNKDVKEWTIEKQEDKFVVKALHTNQTQDVYYGYIGYGSKKHTFNQYKEYKEWWNNLQNPVEKFRRRMYKTIPAPDVWITKVRFDAVVTGMDETYNTVYEYIRRENYNTFEEAFEIGCNAFKGVPFSQAAEEDKKEDC